jgi:hypothetical protein
MEAHPNRDTLADELKAGVSVGAWFVESDVVGALRTWRALTDKGVPVGMWEVRSKRRVFTPVTGLSHPPVDEDFCKIRLWLVAAKPPKGPGLKVKQKLYPEC